MYIFMLDFEKLTAEERRLLAVLDQPSRPRSRSHSPYVEECQFIASGSVKQQTKHIETKYAHDSPANTEEKQEEAVNTPEIICDTETLSATKAVIKDTTSAQNDIDTDAKVTAPSDDNSDTKSEPSVDTLVVEGVTTDSSTDEDKYEAIRTESMPTLLLEGVVDDGTPMESIVKQHKQAIENKTRTSKKSDEEDAEYKMGPELLTMIRRVGRTLIATPKEESATPSKRVKQVALNIEGMSGIGSDSGYKHYQNRMVIIEKDKASVARRLDLGSPLKGSTNLGRSSSLKEKPVSPGVTPSQVGRSSSLRESASPEKKSNNEADLFQRKFTHVSSTGITLVSPTKSPSPAVDVANTETQDGVVGDRGTNGEDSQGDEGKEPRKVVKDLVGIFEPRPGDIDDSKDLPSTPPRGTTTPVAEHSPKVSSPNGSTEKSSTKSPILERKRSSSTNASADTSIKSSRMRTKSETLSTSPSGKLEKSSAVTKTTTTKTGTAKDRMSKTPPRSRNEGSSPGGLKTSRDPSARGKGSSPKGKDRSPMSRHSDGSKSRLSPSPSGAKKDSSRRTSPSRYRKDDARTKTSPSGTRVRAGSQGKGDDAQKRAAGGRTSPKVDIKSASALATKDMGKRSPKSTSPSPSPPGAGKPTRTGGRSPVSRTLFPDNGKGHKTQGTDRKSSSPLQLSAKNTAAEPGHTSLHSCKAGTDQSQGTTQATQSTAHATQPAIGSAKIDVTSQPQATGTTLSSTDSSVPVSSPNVVLSPITGQPFIPLSAEMLPSEDVRSKLRKAHGKSHPLSKLKAKNYDTSSGPSSQS